MASSEQLIEIASRHQVFLERLKASETKKYDPFLKEVDKVIRNEISKGNVSNFSIKRLETIIGRIESNIDEINAEYIKELNSSLRDFSSHEAGFEQRSLNQILDNAEASPAQGVWQAVLANPLSTGNGSGRLLKPFIKDWSNKQKRMVSGAIRLGFAQGQTNQEIITAIRGTKQAQFKDGLLSLSKRESDAVVRTSIQHIASTARAMVWEANKDIVTGYEWVSTLDSRTTSQCRSLDGQVFKVGKGPLPPIHVSCRSTTAAALNEKFKFLKKGATRSSVDGPVPSNQTYYSWLKKQPAGFQNEALGPTRGKLFRNGGLTSEEFSRLSLDKNFQPLTLDEMRLKEPLAFEQAGI